MNNIDKICILNTKHKFKKKLGNNCISSTLKSISLLIVSFN